MGMKTFVNVKMMTGQIGSSSLVTCQYPNICHVDTTGDIILWSTESGHMRSRLILPGILALKGDQRPIEGVAFLECGVHTIGTGGRQVCANLQVLLIAA
jgi:hypothetical protein